MRQIEQTNQSSREELNLDFKDKDGNVTEEQSRDVSKSEEGSVSRSPNVMNRAKNVQDKLKDAKDDRMGASLKKDDDEKAGKRSSGHLGST